MGEDETPRARERRIKKWWGRKKVKLVNKDVHSFIHSLVATGFFNVRGMRRQRQASGREGQRGKTLGGQRGLSDHMPALHFSFFHLCPL